MPVVAVNPLDKYRANPAIDPPSNFAAVTPSDTDQLAVVARGIYVGGDGNLVVLGLEDTVAVTFVGLKAGATIVGNIKQVLSTDTTATNLVAMW
jgi:hypothetical protein